MRRRGFPGRGSAAVELALVLPLALLAALALVQVGLVAKDSLVVIQAAREGAREAAVTTDDGRVREAALRGGGGLPEDRTEVEVVRAGTVGDPVTVIVRYRAPMVVPFVEWLFPDEVTLSGTGTMRQETTGEES
ncbi:MAG TPA: TadE/TadG family type IV pilus assembly protein [Actinomycetota bacterium]|nr:TadE/TadG family type IV pilus assembly protein [Actinomycetota bacterium]